MGRIKGRTRKIVTPRSVEPAKCHWVFCDNPVEIIDHKMECAECRGRTNDQLREKLNEYKKEHP
jgi:hypothetical protein